MQTYLATAAATVKLLYLNLQNIATAAVPHLIIVYVLFWLRKQLKNILCAACKTTSPQLLVKQNNINLLPIPCQVRIISHILYTPNYIANLLVYLDLCHFIIRTKVSKAVTRKNRIGILYVTGNKSSKKMLK